ncbi:MAG: hypothetical protein NDI94_00700 [Candidatus Woesearchaeota archaeon]|nr:hypothetical protein [Candidatus Woesearchaeota archaeon]
MARYLGSSHYFNMPRADTPMLFITDFGIPYMSDIYALACNLAPQGLDARISEQYPAFDYEHARTRFFHEVDDFMKTYSSKNPLPIIGVIDPDKNTKRIVVKLLYHDEKLAYMAIPDNGLISLFATDNGWRILEAREIKDLEFLPDNDLRESEKSLWDGFDRFTPGALFSSLGRFNELANLNEIHYYAGGERSLRLPTTHEQGYRPKTTDARKIIVHFSGPEEQFHRLEEKITYLLTEEKMIIQTAYHGNPRDSFEAACLLRFNTTNILQPSSAEHIYLSSEPEAYLILNGNTKITVAGKNDGRFSLLDAKGCYHANEDFLDDYIYGRLTKSNAQRKHVDYRPIILDDYSIIAKVERGVDCNGNRPLLARLDDIKAIYEWRKRGVLDEMMNSHVFLLSYIINQEEIFSFTVAYRKDYDPFDMDVGIDKYNLPLGIIENPEIGTRRSRIELFEAYGHLGDRIRELKGHEIADGYIKIEVVKK